MSVQSLDLGRGMNARFMTPDAKEAALSEWANCLQNASDGPGSPDPDIIPWCDEINALGGFCTLQSCAGHGSAEAGNVEAAGHLWLWMDEPTSRVFDQSAFHLARHPHIERVARIYTSWGQEVASITFHGNERHRLAESMQAILSFLRQLEGYVVQLPAFSLARHSLSNSPDEGRPVVFVTES